MKKISQNAKIPVRVGFNKMTVKSQDKQVNVKASLNQIQRLSEQIDLQIQMNEQKHRRIQLNKQINLPTQEQQEDSNEMPNEQNYKTDSQSCILDRAVQFSVQQYFGFNLNTFLARYNNSGEKDQMNSRKVRFVDIKSYEEYKKIRQFNSDFKQIVQKMQELRRLSLLDKFSGQQKQLKLQDESDMIYLLSRAFKVADKMNHHNEESNFCCDDSLLLKTIQKIQEIQESVQTKVQSLEDDISFKRRVIQELRANQNTINDDIQLLESRNYKLSKQLQSIQSKSKYNHSSEEEDNQPKQTQQTNQHPSFQSHNESLEKQTQTDYQIEYQQLMHQYELYDPLTNIIQQPFPKNKTEAMMLLNKIEAKIQKIEMKKVLQSLP